MASRNVSSASTLLLVPTDLELELLAAKLGDTGFGTSVEVCGFGPVAAAARAARLIELQKPSRVILAGIAGTFCPDTLPIGVACCFRQVAMDGIGVGESNRFVSAHDLGFAQVGVPEDLLPLEIIGVKQPQDLLLTCCAASDSAGMAAERLSRHPSAVAEDLEGFGVAAACHFARVPLTILRGISNLVGNRNKNAWVVDKAIQATADLLRTVLASDLKTGEQG